MNARVKGTNVEGLGGKMSMESFCILRKLRFGNQLGRTVIVFRSAHLNDAETYNEMEIFFSLILNGL